MPTATTHHPESDSDSEFDDEEEQSNEDYAQFPRNDSPDSIEEVEANEFPLYFSERNARLFHSSPTAPYPLPVDAGEQERLNALNDLLKDMNGANYHTDGPVAQMLEPSPDKQKHVLDLCTGTGRWVMEMAESFPHVLFTGVDIVPIATRYPLPNVTFEVGDLIEEFRWADSTFDFVHARDVALSFHDYRTILPEVARLLCPGGLFFSGEWELRVRHQADSQQPVNGEHNDLYPSTTQFYQVVNAAVQNLGIVTEVGRISDYLAESGLFHQIQSNTIHFPVGVWPNDQRLADLGVKFQGIQTRFADSVKPLLRDMGNAEQFIDALAANFVHEIRTNAGLVAAYHYVHAIRI